MNLREQILEIDDLPRKKLNIPEWNLDIYIASMSSGDRELWEKSAKDIKDVRETIVCLVAVDKDGNKIFSKEDIPLLKNKNAKALDRIALAAIEHNKISSDDIDDLEKN